MALLSNLIARSDNFKEFADDQLTFHIGDARDWLRSEYADYDAHNTRELMSILAQLESAFGMFAPDSIPSSFLRRKKRFGPFYDFWSRHVYLPVGLSRTLNRLSGRKST